MSWLLSLLTGGVVEKFTGPLLDAYRAKLSAANDAERIEADKTIKRIESARDIAVAETADRWSATRLGRWLIVVPFGLWWAAIYLVQIVNPWFGLSLVVIDVPAKIHDMALILIPAIVLGDAGALIARKIGR
ncbi:MAG: hypothetical protein KYX69_19700 [Sphingomonas sp.]|uniref:hypothetical protein n=1 Tax=Sphingomonas sp. TaxID=28214 RepID=UPI002615E974|nr:hypothetical protein [Sphingomonas sp.]MDK2769929.1 hypothetical protein [Sphingomonas sp.]